MYLILFDEQGERITSLVIGVHGSTMEELKERAKEFSPAIMLEADAATQEAACGNVIFKDGKFIEKEIPEVEEPLEIAMPEINVAEAIADIITMIEELKGE